MKRLLGLPTLRVLLISFALMLLLAQAYEKDKYLILKLGKIQTDVKVLKGTYTYAKLTLPSDYDSEQDLVI